MYKLRDVFVDYRGKPVKAVAYAGCGGCCYDTTMPSACSLGSPCPSSLMFREIRLDDLINDKYLAITFSFFEEVEALSKVYLSCYNTDLNPIGFWKFFKGKGCIRLCDQYALGKGFCRTNGVTILPYESVKHLFVGAPVVESIDSSDSTTAVPAASLVCPTAPIDRDQVRAIPLIQFMFDEYNLKIKDKPTYIFEKFKDSGYDNFNYVKREPLKDGTLPLTEKEMEEFGKLVNIKFIKQVSTCANLIICTFKSDNYNGEHRAINDYKAISWLLERFNLTERNHGK